MEMKEAVIAALKEVLFPEIQDLKNGQREIKATLVLTNKRLDDMNVHLVDQSRRMEINKRLDETNKRVDGVRDELTRQIQEINKRLDRLYEVIVRREEHQSLEARLLRLEQDMAVMKQRLAA